MYLNLELSIANSNHNGNDRKRRFGRIIFHTEDEDKLYFYFKGNMNISSLISFGNEPTNAAF
jgi:hypothetical protein